MPVQLDGILHTIVVEGPEPKVKIGASCRELVLGKVQMIIDGIVVVPVYLDSKLQTFEYEIGKHTLQLADYFATVFIDGVPLTNVDYGGFPRSFKIGNKKCFLRFSTLPKGVLVGKPTVIEPVAVADEGSQDQPESFEKTPGPMKLDDLLLKLMSSGLISTAKAEEEKKEETPPRQPPVRHRFGDDRVNVDLKRPETIKKRNFIVVESLFSGMQCSSCGVRFPPEQTVKYSQHLDWHFRQNRRDRDASKRAHSRKWYYDVSDWIQYEEIEDLEEREQNWFEKHGTVEVGDDVESPKSPTAAMVSCPAGPKGANETCDVCHDKFEYFYNEETEDWHLKDATRVDDKIYHPTCYDDMKAIEQRQETEQDKSMDDSTSAAGNETIEGGEEEYVPEETKLDTLEDDFDDDVIALSPQKPTITEILDDDDDETGYRVNEIEDNSADSPKVEAKADPKPEDDVIDTTEVKVKEEKIDDSYETFDPFEDVGTIEADPDTPMAVDDEASNASLPQPTDDPNHEVVRSPVHQGAAAAPTTQMDGNLSMTYAPQMTVNKIRINITKPLSQVTSEPKEDEFMTQDSELPATPEAEPTFEVRPNLASVEFKKLPPLEAGTDASGLCTIM